MILEQDMIATVAKRILRDLITAQGGYQNVPPCEIVRLGNFSYRQAGLLLEAQPHLVWWLATESDAQRN